MKEVDLISWLPKYLQEYKELIEIMNVENPEIDFLNDEIDTLLKNQFILTCDEKGISRFEKLLGITPSIDDDLQGRITRVLSRWNDSIPYTYKGLIQKLNILCGEGNYELNLINDEYRLELSVFLLFGSQIQELKHMLSYMIPANLVVSLETVRKAYSNLYTGIGINRKKNLKLNIKTGIEDLIKSSFFVGIGVNRNKKSKIFIRNNSIFKAEQYLGVGINRVRKFIISFKPLVRKSILGQFRVGEIKVGEINENT